MWETMERFTASTDWLHLDVRIPFCVGDGIGWQKELPAVGGSMFTSMGGIESRPMGPRVRCVPFSHALLTRVSGVSGVSPFLTEFFSE